MFHLSRYFYLKMVCMFFLTFSLANGQGGDFVKDDQALQDLTSSFNQLDNANVDKINDREQFLNVLKDIKEDLNLEKSKLEKFEESFWNLCEILKKTDSTKEERLNLLALSIKDLKALLDSNESIIGLNDELKEKIFLLGDLIRLYISNEGLELDSNDQSISEAIDVINDFINDQSNKNPVVDDDKEDSLNDNELPNEEFIENNEIQNEQDVQSNDDDKIENVENNNFSQEDFNSDQTREMVVDTAIDTEDSQANIADSDVVPGEDSKKDEKYKNKSKWNKTRNVVLNSLKDVAKNYWTGGYPVQFIHQLARNMDKVNNKIK